LLSHVNEIPSPPLLLFDAFVPLPLICEIRSDFSDETAENVFR
jgi:hypothetical protein